MEKINLPAYFAETEQELKDILAYWMRYTIDEKNGGFYGKIDQGNIPDPEAPKGVVLNSRILWTFSAAFNQTGDPQYLGIAQRAYQYLLDHFTDPQYGGVYWSVDYSGQMLNGRKQVYGIAFCLYAFSEYYKASGNRGILENAVSLFRLIEQYGYDESRKGYYEAFSRDWQAQHDLRLSEKDANEKKTMNTHLHVIEAYANLYTIWPDAFLKQQIENLLYVFTQHIIDPETGHLGLFFDEEWTIKSTIISFGHDIEAAWLLLEAAEIIKSEKWINCMRGWAIKIAKAAGKGLDSDGGLWYEYDTTGDHLVKEKHWWPQAEAMVGFLNAFEISKDDHFLKQSFQSWQFIKKYIKDGVYGEWFWGVDAGHLPMPEQDKAGFWKCPYHNTRACIEVMKRLPALFPK